VTAVAAPVTAGRSADVEALLARVEKLEDELADLRSTLGPLPPVPADVVIAISAAVAAFLGKRATIRQVHLAGDTSWARQGRSAVQTTHVRPR
jgi:methylmalonyl-CoA carboxyltransferase 12S subunit